MQPDPPIVSSSAVHVRHIVDAIVHRVSQLCYECIDSPPPGRVPLGWCQRLVVGGRRSRPNSTSPSSHSRIVREAQERL